MFGFKKNKKAKIIDGVLGAMRPIPINGDRYKKELDAARGTTKESIRQMTYNMFLFYETQHALIQPVQSSIIGGACQWRVIFPDGSKFKDGPVASTYVDALIQNYEHNHRGLVLEMNDAIEGIHKTPTAAPKTTGQPGTQEA